MRAYVNLIRIPQWTKNAFVFLPLFFDKRLTILENFLEGCYAFLSFSLIASAVYCFNDLKDFEFDKNHFEKKNRPLASGELKKNQVKTCFCLLVVFGFFLSSQLLREETSWILLSYLVFNLCYTLVLKNILFIDILCIATSFVLRILVGGSATNTPLSYWILSLVFLLAFFLATAKRKDEALLFQEKKRAVRKNIAQYKLKILEFLLRGTSLITVSVYLCYVFFAEPVSTNKQEYIPFTSVFVMLGMGRYLYLSKKRVHHVNPTALMLKDLPLQLIVAGWLGAFYLLIY
jgi:4-hydroxybenzoate polyprenyltransferase